MAHDDIFKEHYFFELGRRDTLNSSLSFPVGLVTLLAGALFVMSGRISPTLTPWNVVLAVSLVFCAGSLVVSTVFLIKAYWGYTYKYMPLLSELLNYKEGLASYFMQQGNSKSKAEEMATARFDRDINSEYAEHCKINSLNNDSKSSNTFKANSFIVGAIAAAILASPAYLMLSLLSPESPHKVEITNLKDMTMPDEQQGNESKPAEPAKEPVMPPSRDVKEHVDPLKTK